MKGKITRTTSRSRAKGKTDFKGLRQARINAILRSYMKAQSGG